jgi:hypothetical protein
MERDGQSAVSAATAALARSIENINVGRRKRRSAKEAQVAWMSPRAGVTRNWESSGAITKGYFAERNRSAHNRSSRSPRRPPDSITARLCRSRTSTFFRFRQRDFGDRGRLEFPRHAHLLNGCNSAESVNCNGAPRRNTLGRVRVLLKPSFTRRIPQHDHKGLAALHKGIAIVKALAIPLRNDAKRA